MRGRGFSQRYSGVGVQVDLKLGLKTSPCVLYSGVLVSIEEVQAHQHYGSSRILLLTIIISVEMLYDRSHFGVRCPEGVALDHWPVCETLGPSSNMPSLRAGVPVPHLIPLKARAHIQEAGGTFLVTYLPS